MVRITFKIVSFNEVTSKGELMGTLSKIEIFSSDLGIFSLWIFSVWDENKTTFIYFVGVTKAVFGGIWRIDTNYSVNFKETGRRFLVLLDINVALIFWIFYFIFLASTISILFVFSRRKSSCARDCYWLNNYNISSSEASTPLLNLISCNSTLPAYGIISF
jgi:hypothetical protein